MALAIAQTLAFQSSGYLGDNPLVSASVSLPANSLVIVTTGSAGYLGGEHIPNTPTNTGTSLTWNAAAGNGNSDGSGWMTSGIWWAKNTSAQSITISVYYNYSEGYDVWRVLSGYVITGHNTTTPIGAVVSGSTSLTTTASNSLALLGITDESPTATTSSNMTATTVSGGGNSFLAYASVASPSAFNASLTGSFTIPAFEMVEILAAPTATVKMSVGMLTL